MVQCPTEMIDQLGGWSRQAIGERYGSGYGLSQTHESMLAITLTEVFITPAQPVNGITIKQATLHFDGQHKVSDLKQKIALTTAGVSQRFLDIQ